MAVDNTTIGSVLTIPKELLDNLEAVDKKIDNIQKKSSEMTKAVNKDFAALANGDIKSFLEQLTAVATNMGNIGAKIGQGVGSGMKQASQSASQMTSSITQAAEQINRMNASSQKGGFDVILQNIKNRMQELFPLLEKARHDIDLYNAAIGTGKKSYIDFGQQGLKETQKNAEILMRQIEALNVAYSNVSSLKRGAGISDLVPGSSMNDRRNLETLKRMSEYYKELEKSSAKQVAEASRRAAEEEKARDREAKAAEKAAAQAEKAAQRKAAAEAKAAEKAAAQEQYKHNTSYQGSLSLAGNATSINQRTQAIKYLTEARNALSKTDAEYSSKLEKLNAKIKELNAANRQAIASSQELNSSHRNLMDTAGQLQRAFALMFSVSQIRGYINQIAQVRGEFELQQRSLEAILQNKTEADAIFNKTVMLAVQSPFQIKDLISYTKQLAAYRIESDKLYDTTKRLADVSAGLGVDMQRLILAYGQVKAAAYLRGTEVRQFTEAGINLYGELQAYFKEVKGEAYTTAQIVDMISKRMVTFEDVEAIFKRITDQGGIFYNMQAIQAETLQGKIANLKDSIDVMLNSIGYANEGMYKFAIDGANIMIRNWQLLADVGLRLVEVLALIKLHSITTGKAMGATFLDIAKFQRLEGISSTVGLLSVSFKNFGRALYAAGVMAKAAMAQFLPLLLLMEVWQVISRIIDVNTEYNKTIRESTQAYADETAKINKVVNSIKDLQKAREDAIKSKDKDFDFKQNWDMQKSNLQTLYDRLKQEKLEVPLEISKVTQENIDSVVADAQQKLQLGYQMIADTQRELAGSNSNFFFGNGQGLQSLLPDNFDTDMNDLENAAADVRAYATQIQASIALVGEQYNRLDDVSKKAYDSIKNGARKGEVDVNYVIRAYDELEKILNGYAASNPMLNASREQFNDYAHSIMGLKTQIEGIWQFNSQKETATKQLQDLFDSLDGIYGARLAKMKPAEVKVEWNKVATAAKLQDLERYILLTIAAKKYKFKVEGDEEDLAKQLNWVDNYIRTYFAGKKYSATISLQTNVDAMEEFLNKGDAEAKIAQTAKKFVDRFGKSVSKNTKKLDVDQKILDLFSGSAIYNYKLGDKIDADIVLSRAKEILAKATDLAKNGYGVDPFDKNGTKAEKAQRDLIKERIEAYKELQSQYEKYLKMYDKETAKTKALESLKYKLQNAGIYGDAVGIFPDEKTIAEKIKGLAAQYKDLSKRGDAYKIVADLMLQIDQEQLKKELDAAKNQIDDAFSGLNVYTDLKKLGLGESDIAKMFGDLPKTFDDVQKKIAEVYNGKEGEDWAKQRQETEKKLQEQVVKYNLDTFKELTKAYKTNLSEQLQLDEWYYSERMKIMQNEQLKANSEMQKQYLANLDKQYAEKSDANSWKQFQDSEFYIKIFENLDVVSSRVLKEMSSRLENIRGSLKNLSPEQLKQVVSATEQVNTQLVSRNPFKGLLKNIKEYAAFQKTRNELEKKFIDSSAKGRDLQSQSKQQSDIVHQKKEEYDAAVKTYGAMSGQAGIAYNAYLTEKEKLDIILDELVAQGEITQEYANQIRNGEKIKKTLQEQVKGISDQFSQLSSGWGEFESMMNNFGVEFPEEISGALNGLSQASGGISKIVNGDIIGGLFSTISGVGNTVANLFGFGNKDNKLQKQIEEQERAIKRLQWAYEDLKESMDGAMTAADLLINKDDMIDNLKATNASLSSMISLEQSKKNSNQDQIEEWQRQIQENNKAIKELEQTVTEEMGGFGDKANYKSAAQAFADAWVDAFNEASDTLQALEDTFDDYFDNLLKKQIMQSVVGKYINPVLEQIDKIVQEGSLGGTNGLQIVKEEIDDVLETWNNTKGPLNDILTGLFETWGLSPRSSSTLSQLQQGIQSLSESTGQALESLLNSIRFFVAQQSTDVAAIRQLLAAGSSLNTTTDTNTPMLKELQAQTNYLSKIYSMLGSVVKAGGHPKAGAGIKVFQD